MLSRSLPHQKGNVLLTVISPWNSTGRYILLYVKGGQKLQWQCWHSATHCQRRIKGQYSLVSGGGALFTKVSCFFSGVAQAEISFPKRGASGGPHHMWSRPSRPSPPSAAAAAVASQQDTPPFQHCATGHHHWQWSHPSAGTVPPQPQSLPRGMRLPPMPPTSL